MTSGRRWAEGGKKRRFWLTLHPYVHTSVKGGRVLVYNTLNGRVLEWESRSEIGAIVKRLASRRNLYVVELAEAEVTPEVSSFIQALRDHFMGEWMDASLSSGRPVQVSPRVCLPDASPVNRRGNPLGKPVKEYWQNLNLYITNRCRQRCGRCFAAFRQFTHCTRSPGRGELTVQEMEELLRETFGSRLKTINLLGGDIFLHPDFFRLVDCLRKHSQQRQVFFSHMDNIPDDPRFLQALPRASSALKVLAGFPLDAGRMARVWRILGDAAVPVQWKWVVTGREELAQAGEWISRFKMQAVEIAPYYTGANLPFFREHVFLKRENLFKKPLPMAEIFARQTLNRLNFGSLTITADKRVHANLNHPPLGIWGERGIADLIEVELGRWRSWGSRRGQVKPCRDCVYQCLCPPISNYEHVLGRFNLCRIFPERRIAAPKAMTQA